MKAEGTASGTRSVLAPRHVVARRGLITGELPEFLNEPSRGERLGPIAIGSRLRNASHARAIRLLDRTCSEEQAGIPSGGESPLRRTGHEETRDQASTSLTIRLSSTPVSR